MVLEIIIVGLVRLGHAVGDVDPLGLGFVQSLIDARDNGVGQNGSIQGTDAVQDQISRMDRFDRFDVGLHIALIKDRLDVVNEAWNIGLALDDRIIIHAGK